jgi:hypothetical protein
VFRLSTLCRFDSRSCSGSHHGAKHGEFVTDDTCDSFCVVGTAERATEKLRERESIGVDQFDVYLMTDGQQETLNAYGKEIIPQFTGVATYALLPGSDRAAFEEQLQAVRRRGRVVLVDELWLACRDHAVPR